MVRQPRREHRRYWVHRSLNRLAGVRSPRGYWWIQLSLNGSYYIAGAFLALILVYEPQPQSNEWWNTLFDRIHTYKFSIATFIILGQLILRAIIWAADKLQSFEVAKLKKVLNHVVERRFTQQDRAVYDYRATLFKVRSCWLCGSWLGIVARSGDLYPQRTTVFSIDAKNKKYNTGIAGECWRRKDETIIAKLPELTEGSPSEDAQNQFKTAGYLADCEYQRMSVKSTVLLATGIRVAGKVWGVLVLDSTDPNQFPKPQQKKRETESLEFAAVALEQLVS